MNRLFCSKILNTFNQIRPKMSIPNQRAYRNIENFRAKFSDFARRRRNGAASSVKATEFVFAEFI